MGKMYYSRPLLLKALTRLAFGMVFLASANVISDAISHANSPAGMVISKEGNNVNVSLDTETSSDVSIRRNDDTMIIRIPKSSSSMLQIDESLRKNNIVHETETPTGKTITINSQQIYLMTHENGDGLSASPPDAQKSSAKPVQGKSSPKTHSTEDATEITAAPAKHPHNEAPTKPDSAVTSTSQKPDSPNKPETTSKPVAASKKGHPDPGLAKIASLLDEVNRSALPEVPTADLSKPESSASKKANLPPTENSRADSPASVFQPPEQLGDTATEADPEAQPLNLSEQAHNSAVQASSGTMLRIVISLLLVLTMIAGFIKMLLPKLMAQYPAFFENLQKQSQQSLEGTPLKPTLKPVNSEPKAPQKSFLSFFAPTKPVESSKKNYLERLNIDGNHFNVMTSTSLGKGKELHLVEIRGRQLLVATTPYTVSLLHDITDDVDHWETDDTTDESDVHSERAKTRETRAYVSSEPAAQRPRKIKPYASTGLQTSIVSAPPPEKASETSIQPTEEPIHLKYLGQPADNGAQPYPTALGKLPENEPAPMLYVDAEEVVVLEDYDDVYRY